MEYVSIKDLDFSYDNNEVFKNLNINFFSGKCYVVSGLNGSGKSTLLKIIAGKILCQQDKVSVKGHDPFRQTICNSFINYVNMTVVKNIRSHWNIYYFFLHFNSHTKSPVHLLFF